MANESNERSLDKKEKIEILDLYKESGLSKVEFANEYGLNYKSFCNWSRLLEKGESVNGWFIGFVKILLRESSFLVSE